MPILYTTIEIDSSFLFAVERRKSMTLQQRKYVSFFIRIWEEPREMEDENPEWRGSVENVQTGQKNYFKGMENLVGFIREQCNGFGVSWNKKRYIA
jgi:hypothetical protein